ncbi:MAG TPA: hypothetical protein PKN87_03590 [Syntrophomonadaceae bacterium]|nr:hypothetical protein [Syntrophomonadaceae bacterium]HNX28478.1 hypothetical protein [Syntrophomonadaceae bacterium]HPR93088.1 hypothetical protein [Syntrophomonadaceae bacterium]
MIFEPLTFNGKVKIPLKHEDIMDADVYEEVWLPLGDDMETDLIHLLEQGRIKKG